MGSHAQLKAFPGAEGYGSLASGGRGGEVYIVTNRNNSGAGSFREAFNTNGTTPRTIVFETGGTITLDSRITLSSKNNITIAGQTAPGGGILIRGDAFSINNSNNIIVRHMRFRYDNDAADRDTIAVSASTNVIFDHVSASWGRDETLSLTNAVNNITVQNCIIAEGTRSDHQYGSLINSTAPNGRITLWRNLYINQLGRTPRAASQNGEDFLLVNVNNVVYNWGVEGDWGSQSCVSDNERAIWNMINNIHIAGPATTKNFFEDLLNRYSSTILRGGSGNDSAYLSGNIIDSNRNGTLDLTAAGWSNTQGGITQLANPKAVDSWADISTVQSPADALATVIADAGSMPWNRDAVDTRLITELQSYGTQGSIRTSHGSFPSLATGTASADTDRDGMPNTWETWYGTNPAVKDNNLIAPNEYTALENYLQWIIDPDSVTPLPVEEEGEGVLEGEGTADGEGTAEGEGAAEGEGQPEGEGQTEGEGQLEGEGFVDGEGAIEGGVEGDVEGSAEGSVDGEGSLEGAVEGEGEGQTEGGTEGTVEGEGTTDGEGASEGEGEGDIEGGAEGNLEGSTEGQTEGNTEGVAEGEPEGVIEGNPEGTAEGGVEGSVEGTTEGSPEGEGASEGGVEGTEEGEGLAEGQPEGEGSNEGAADGEGTGDGEAELPTDGEGDDEGNVEAEVTVAHSADQNGDSSIDLTELLRVIQLYNAGALSCAAGEGESEDGFAIGTGDITCAPHTSDYAPQDWTISLSELLRLIQFYNLGSFVACEAASEDGLCITFDTP